MFIAAFAAFADVGCCTVKRHIPFERLHNFRDLGGYVTEDGRAVRWEQVYRSDSLSKLRGADWDRFLALGVRTVIDLRQPWEIEAKGRVPEHPTLAYHQLNVEDRTRSQSSPDPDGPLVPYLRERYLTMAEAGAKELRRALEVLADDGSGPVVFHCVSGKDRTGLLAALLLALLGVAEADIVEDYARTELAADRFLADWRADHPEGEPTWLGFGRAPAEAMRLFLAGMSERYGSLRAYAEQLLGVDAELVAGLRRNLLAPAAGRELSFRRADESDVPVLVRLRDEAARWQIAQGIAQWKPGELGEEHFRARLLDSEIWIATLGPEGPVAGAWELWWDDPAAWGPQPPAAGYVHSLMTDRRVAPPGTGRRMLEHAERRVRAAGRSLCRLDCRANNPRLRAYYAAAGFEVVGEQPSKDGGVAGRFAATLLQKRVRDDEPHLGDRAHAADGRLSADGGAALFRGSAWRLKATL
ncbi:GNAT family N-acetyltransferase [Streptomyces flavofungini]|uniref:GNAT family N-acetyltransferase n=1 Tax=Streptomyces flavofungini TaxID=68200 RepID=UPI0025AF63AF|nr:GNAT family N-acetyltransferase [Streptomyces flavofungini]WJV50392.1 GNAT family N-acetyltransferase [Streptomyces flavofungini]